MKAAPPSELIRNNLLFVSIDLCSAIAKSECGQFRNQRRIFENREHAVQTIVVGRGARKSYVE
jgi:hypothetical protein